MKRAALAVLGILLGVATAQARVEREAGEALVRSLMPATARCQSSEQERLFICRHQTETQKSVVLELTFGADSRSGSLTYTFDDPLGRNLLTIVERYFAAVGLGARDFGSCIQQSLWQSKEVVAGRFEVTCRSVVFGDRITHEIFATEIDRGPAPKSALVSIEPR